MRSGLRMDERLPGRSRLAGEILRSRRASLGQLRLLAVVGLLIYGCGGEVDRRDEAGEDPADAAERYELVFMDDRDRTEADRQPVDTDPGLVAAPGETTRTHVRETSDPDDRPLAVRPERTPVTPSEPPPAPAPQPSEEEDPAGPSLPVVMDPNGTFVVQVGSFSDRAGADRLVRELINEGYPAYRIAAPRGQTHRVRIGFFRSTDDAERFGAIFKADHGMDFWVDRRRDGE